MTELGHDQARGAKAAVTKAAQKPHPLSPSSRGSSTPKGQEVSFSRESFSTRMGGQPNIGKGGRHLEEGVSPSPEVAFSKETIDGLRDFTKAYVQRLIDLQSTAPSDLIHFNGRDMTKYAAMVAQQGEAYAFDEEMLNLFAPRDPQTGERKLPVESDGRKIDDKKINAILFSNPQIIEGVSVAMERYISDCLAAVHLRAMTENPGNRPHLGRYQRTMHLPMDRGMVNDAGHRLAHWLGEPLQNAGRDTGRSNLRAVSYTLGAGAVVGGAVLAGPAVLGAGLGAEIGGVAAGMVVAPIVGRLLRPGVSLHFVQEQTIGVLPTETLRTQYFLKIDPANPMQAADLGNRLQEVYQLLHTRAQYMRAIGVDGQNLDALSEQWIYNQGQRPEDTGDKMRIRVQERYQVVRDQLLHAHPLPPGTTLTLAQQRELYRQAQRDVLVDSFRTARTEASRTATTESLESTIARVQKGIEGRGENGTIIQERTKDANDEKGRLDTDKTSLQANSGPIEGLRTKVSEVQTDSTKLADILTRTRAGAVAYPTAADALSAMRSLLSDPAGPATMTIVLENGTTVNIQNIAVREDDAEAALQAELNNIATMPLLNPRESAASYEGRQTQRRTAAERSYQRRMEPIIRERLLLEGGEENGRTISGAIERLETISERIRKVGEEALGSEQVTKGAEQIVEITRAYERISQLIGVDDDYISATDFSELIRQANELHNIDPNHGWAENENAQMRIVFRRAIIQARANVLERADPTLAPNEADFTQAITWRYTLEQLSLLSPDDLVTRFAQLNPGVAAPANLRAQLEHAQAWARGQLRYFDQSFRTESTNIQNAVDAQDRRIRNVDTELEVAQLTMIKGILTDASKLDGRASTAIFDDVRRRNLEDVRPVTVAANQGEGYTAAEEASHLPRNVLEVINILTNYQNPEGGDRNGAFDRIWKNINANPATLAIFVRMLNRSFEGQLTAAPDIDTFARRFRTALRTRRVNEGNFGYFTTPMLRELIAWGNSI